MSHQQLFFGKPILGNLRAVFGKDSIVVVSEENDIFLFEGIETKKLLGYIFEFVRGGYVNDYIGEVRIYKVARTSTLALSRPSTGDLAFLSSSDVENLFRFTEHHGIR